jgi:hypothetical protein
MRSSLSLSLTAAGGDVGHLVGETSLLNSGN